MDIDSPKVQAYLYQLNEITGSDPAAQVSMYDVGQPLGLEPEEAAQMAEVLFMGGHAELKTLSGGIGITAMGMDALGVTPVPAAANDTFCLSCERIMTDLDRGHTQALVADIKGCLACREAGYDTLETVVMDIKTIEVHMLSSAPKTAVVREVFTAIVEDLPKKEFGDIRHRILGAVQHQG